MMEAQSMCEEFYIQVSKADDNETDDNEADDNQADDNETENNEAVDYKADDNETDDNEADDNKADEDESEDSIIHNKMCEIIQNLMYRYGDCSQPETHSVSTMLFVLRDQMNALFHQMLANSKIRQSEEVTHEDILFLMRKSKPKLKSLLRYMRVLDQKKSMSNLSCGKASDSLEDQPSDPKSSKSPCMDKCMDFLAKIEDLKEYTSLLEDGDISDHGGLKRRLLRQSVKSSQEQGSAYAETVNYSFRNEDFVKWFLKGHDEIKITDFAMELVCYLARETVAEVVDMALLEKVPEYDVEDLWDFLENTCEDKGSDEDSKSNVECDEDMEVGSKSKEPLPARSSTKIRRQTFDSETSVSEREDAEDTEDAEVTESEGEAKRPVGTKRKEPVPGQSSTKMRRLTDDSETSVSERDDAEDTEDAEHTEDTECMEDAEHMEDVEVTEPEEKAKHSGEKEVMFESITAKEIKNAMMKFFFRSNTHPLMFYSRDRPKPYETKLLACVPTP